MNDIVPFQLDIQEDQLADLKLRLAMTRLPDRETPDDWSTCRLRIPRARGVDVTSSQRCPLQLLLAAAFWPSHDRRIRYAAAPLRH